MKQGWRARELTAMNLPLSAAERKQHADAMFNAKQYGTAEAEYRDLQHNEAGLTQADRDALEIYAAVCDLRLKRLSKGDVEHLPVTNDDSAALKLYMQSELARNEGRSEEHDTLVGRADGKVSGQPVARRGALLGRQYVPAEARCSPRDPEVHGTGGAFSAQHLRAERALAGGVAELSVAELSAGRAKLMEEQVTGYPAATEIPGGALLARTPCTRMSRKISGRR